MNYWMKITVGFAQNVKKYQKVKKEQNFKNYLIF